MVIWPRLVAVVELQMGVCLTSFFVSMFPGVSFVAEISLCCGRAFLSLVLQIYINYQKKQAHPILH